MLLHIDIKGPLQDSADGHRYFIHFSDDFSKFSRTFALKKKSEANLAFNLMLAEIAQLGHACPPNVPDTNAFGRS